MTDLAIRRHHQEHGQWPSELLELVPAYFPAVPIDPFSGKTLVYRRQGDEFLLYSVGEDGQDNDGRLGTYAESYKPGFDRGLDFQDDSQEQ
jgi:hypothetical protein